MNLLSKTVLALSLVTCVSISAQQEPWVKLTHDEIGLALSSVELSYKGRSRVIQTFREDGSTTYVSGRPSEGFWNVTGNQYCSQWPPSEAWTCYDVFTDQSGDWIRFTGERNDNWDAEILH